MSTELEPAWTKGHYRAGAALTAMARYDEAVEAFQRGISKVRSAPGRRCSRV